MAHYKSVRAWLRLPPGAPQVGKHGAGLVFLLRPVREESSKPIHHKERKGRKGPDRGFSEGRPELEWGTVHGRSGLLRFFDDVAFAGGEEEVGFEAVLAGIEVEVASAQCVEGFVGAAFDDVSAFDDQDLISPADGREAV